MINYSLNPDSSNSETDASEDSCSDSEPEGSIHKAFQPNKPRRQQHTCPPKTDLWLYDTGSSVHIANDQKWFRDFTPDTGNLRPVHTGGGPVMPKGVGTVVLETLYTAEGDNKYRTVTLHGVLLIPQLDVNIFSGIKHYAAGGSLGYDRLYGNNRKPFALLNFMQSRFFLTLKGYPIPRTDHTHFSYYSSSYWITESAPGTTTHVATDGPGIDKSSTDHPGPDTHAATDSPGIDKSATDHPGIAAHAATDRPGIDRIVD